MDYSNHSEKDLYHQLTANVTAASAEESAEILQELENMAEDDLVIVSARKKEFTV